MGRVPGVHASCRPCQPDLGASTWSPDAVHTVEASLVAAEVSPAPGNLTARKMTSRHQSHRPLLPGERKFKVQPQLLWEALVSAPWCQLRAANRNAE